VDRITGPGDGGSGDTLLATFTDENSPKEECGEDRLD